jgi:hypothetical protein
MDKEIFKDIEGYNGLYQISNFGNVKSFCNSKEGIIKKPSIIKKGYKIICLSSVGVKKHYLIHRLVGFYFLEAYPFKNQINHINGDKLDNHFLNLEWVSPKENIAHAFKSGLMKSRITLMQKEVKDESNGAIFKSIGEASKYYNLGYSNLCKMLSGKQINKTSLKFL